MSRALVRLPTGRVPIFLLRDRPLLLLPHPLQVFLQYVTQFTRMYWKSDLYGIKIRWVTFKYCYILKVSSVGGDVYLRMGSWNPLTNLNGFLGTRGTRSNEGPVIPSSRNFDALS